MSGRFKSKGASKDCFSDVSTVTLIPNLLQYFAHEYGRCVPIALRGGQL